MKKVIGIISIFLIAILITGCGGTINNTSTDTTNNTSTDTINNKEGYIEWTNSGYDYSDSQEEWLKVAVQIDSYDGDQLKPGTYVVKQTNSDKDIENQRVYNLYITNLDTENPDEVQNDTFPVTVGGINGSSVEIKLEKGQYLYIQKISGGSIGHINITKK